jgi:hypothetical protein
MPYSGIGASTVLETRQGLSIDNRGYNSLGHAVLRPASCFAMDHAEGNFILA